jgi:MerR family transcriptional regulator, thiopeptide resistance regulator
MFGGTYLVGEVAALAGISVRALHHYDAIGLLVPSGRSDAGYRLYDDDDLAVLHQVMFFRELGFGLDAIGRIMRDPEYNHRDGLVLQRRMLVDRSQHVGRLIAAVDRALDALERGIVMEKKDMFEVFGDFDPAVYEDEVKQRWGDTDAFGESARRAARYTKRDWEAIKAEGDQIDAEMATLLATGVAPGDPRAMDAVEKHRLMIDRRFYPCPHEMHVGLGAMYVADPRFTETYEKIRPGLAQYLCDAIAANAARARSEA